MAIRFQLDHDNVYRVEISGLPGGNEFGALQQSAAAEISKTGKVRLLRFAGAGVRQGAIASGPPWSGSWKSGS